MKRRGFLGFMGGALAAGPSMAKQAAVGIESLALPTIPYPEEAIEGWGGPAGLSTGEHDHLKWMRDRIAGLTGMSAEERRDRMETMSVTQFDPDIAVNRSMALHAKVREQKRRNFEQSRGRELRHLNRELAEWLKREVLS